MGPFSVTGQPNAMGGREVGGLANMLAAHMAIENADDRDRVQRFWQRAAIAEQARPEGRRHVPRRRRRPHQGALDHGDQSGRLDARRRRGRGGARRLSLRRRLRCPHGDTDTTRHAHVLLPAAGLGREGRHRHQFRAPHLAPARVPRRRPARRRPTGGSSPRWPAHGLCRRLRLRLAGRDLRRACGACRPSRTTASAISISARIADR